MSIITPTILVGNYQDLKKQLDLTTPLVDYVQLDIMDGKFVDTLSFNHKEEQNLKEFFEKNFPEIKLELHIMVNDPLDEINRWHDVPQVERVIFHIESTDNPTEVISKINGNCWQAGICLNPETPTERIEPYLDRIKVVQFMTVQPGKQGNPFLPEIAEKIKHLVALNSPVPIAVDGGINENNILEVKKWGVDIFNIGSALLKQSDIESTYQKLKKLITMSS